MRFVPFEYRGIAKDKREFVYGAAMFFDDREIRIASTVLEAHDNPYLLDMVIAPLIDPDSLSVGTRWTDENGMDIYTGDIVEYYWMGDIRIGTVVFEDDTFRVKDNSNNCEGKLQDVKSVIGNIWGVEADMES